MQVALIVLFVIIALYLLWSKGIGAKGIRQITPAELSEMISGQKAPSAKERPLFVDVREPHEYKGGHIQQTKNIPLSSFRKRIREIPTDRTVVLVCRSGNRSMQAARILKGQGYKDIVNVRSGMSGWTGKVIK